MGKDLIAVCGATGAQGGALVQALLSDGTFAVRGLTRNVDSDKAKKLKDQGVEMVKADLDDKESLTAAFQGCYGAYFLTNFWEHFSADKEIQQLKNLADAGKAAELKHVVNSTLENTKSVLDGKVPILHEKWTVPHFDGKGEGSLYVAEHVPTTQFLTSFYYENFISFGMGPQKNDKGDLVIAMPMADKKIAMNSVRDMGRVAAGVFKDASLIGKTVGVSSDVLTLEEVAKEFTSVMGTPVSYYPISNEDYAKLGFPGADDLSNMFRFFAEDADAFIQRRDLKRSRDLSVDKSLDSFHDWLQAHKDAFKA